MGRDGMLNFFSIGSRAVRRYESILKYLQYLGRGIHVRCRLGTSCNERFCRFTQLGLCDVIEIGIGIGIGGPEMRQREKKKSERKRKERKERKLKGDRDRIRIRSDRIG